TPLVVSYHPAYLLRSPLAKSKSWEDLKVVKRLLRTPE
ncbi:MAG: uracil-DNA glycosylase, partial [Proteobacteria bacterium]|nr:uracil-DNA glycosylase [Pseudomonadota bacterium]